MRVLEIGIAGEAWSRALEGRVGPGGSIRVLAAGDLAGPLPLPDGSLDFIWMVSAVERLPDPCAILRECRRILAPAGRIALTEAFLDPGAPGRGDLVALLEGAGFRQVEHEEGIGHHTARGLR